MLKIETDRENGWALVLSYDTPVLDVAALMGGLGVRVSGHMVMVEPERNSVFEIRPMAEGSAPPSLALVQSILRHGLSSYPVLVNRSLQESRGG